MESDPYQYPFLVTSGKSKKSILPCDSWDKLQNPHDPGLKKGLRKWMDGNKVKLSTNTAGEIWSWWDGEKGFTLKKLAVHRRAVTESQTIIHTYR